MFTLYLELGFQHILDWNAYDHLLFLIALTAGYQFKQWRFLLALVTAFTIGHSLSLLAAINGIQPLTSSTVELLIPITIVITAGMTIFRAVRGSLGQAKWLEYLLALVFGLIHGLGFSTYLRMLLGKEKEILKPLLGFNIGIELAQILIVLVFLLLSFFSVNKLRIRQNNWTIGVSSLALLLSLYLLSQILTT